MMPKFVSVFLCSFIAGVIIGSLYDVPLNLVFIGAVIAGVAAVVSLLIKQKLGLAMLCVVFGLAFGLWYAGKSFGVNEYQDQLGRKIDTEGIIVEDPVSEDRGQQVTLLPDGHSQYIRAQLYKAIPGAAKGDRVWIRGELQLPENFSGFDYIGYLQRWQVYAILKKPRVIVLHRATTNWRTPLLAIREYVVRKCQVFPQREGSLILGMLIGQRQTIPQEVTDAFKATGLTHIVAVSGFNMTVIASACGILVWYIGRRATNIMTLVVVFGFVVITGASAAVVRAAIMSVLMVIAQLLGRQYASLYSLLIVSSIMILLNPRVAVWDIGFQLSVAATFGVLIAFRVKNPETPNTILDDLLRPTMGAIAVTAPIIVLHFGLFSVIAPVANMLVLPFVSWIMLFGALALLPLIGGVFVYPAQMLTSIVLFFTEHLAKVPYASIELHLPVWVLGVYYILIFWYIHRRLRSSSLQNQVKPAKV